MSKSDQHPFDFLLDIDRRGRDRAEAAPAELVEPSAMMGRLALRLHDYRLMVSMEDISEITPVPTITQVPGVHPWLMGIANLRGTVISVVNLGEFLISKASTPTKSSRVIVVGAGEWSYGLLVDEVIGMRHFTEQNKVSLPDAVIPELKPFISETYRSEDHAWLVFDVQALVSETSFLDAAA